MLIREPRLARALTPGDRFSLDGEDDSPRFTARLVATVHHGAAVVWAAGPGGSPWRLRFDADALVCYLGDEQ